MSFKYLTDEQYASWKSDVDKFKSETNVFRGKNLRINMHIFMKATDNLIADIRTKDPTISREELEQPVVDIMMNMRMEFLKQYPTNLNEYIEELKSDIEYMKSPDFDNLTKEQSSGINSLLNSLNDYQGIINNGTLTKQEEYDEFYRINFDMIRAMTTFDVGDLRREKIEEAGMLGNHIEIYGAEAYEAFIEHIKNEQETENESTLSM